MIRRAALVSGVALALAVAVPLRPFARPHEQIQRVPFPALPTGTARIAGVVTTEAGRPVAGAKISLNTMNECRGWSCHFERYAPTETTTDELGRFAIANVPHLTLELKASSPGFVVATFGESRPGGIGTPIRLNPNETLTVVIRLSTGTAISGTVVDSAGTAATGVYVHAYSQLYAYGQHGFGEAQSDDRGAYRIAALPPGRYVVYAYRKWGNWQPSPIREISPGVQGVELGASYPDGAKFEDAKPLTLAVGKDRTGIDLRIKVAPVSTIAGTVRTADGTEQAGATVWLWDRTEERIPRGDARTTRADGTFEFSRVEPGRHTLSAAVRGMWGDATIESDGRKPATATIVLKPAGTVKGRVVFDGGVPVPPSSSAAMFYNFLNRAHDGSRYGTYGVTHENTWPEFTFHGVPPGAYVVTPSGPPGWFPRSEFIDGVALDAFDVPFQITGAETRVVTITMTDRRTHLSGVVRDRSGAADPGHAIVVFDVDERFWTWNSRRTAVVRPDTHGRYELRGLPEGGYFVALESPGISDVPDASRLRQLRSSALRVTLREAEPAVHDLRSGR